ncbi:MAG: hypothetical protein IH946_10700 [Bacteroidetes bacterium]|nr:hypothetical protein [Bacteroidota bacterium]
MKIFNAKRIVVLLLLTVVEMAFGQVSQRPYLVNGTNQSLAVMNISSTGVLEKPETMGNMARLEMSKTGLFNVMNKFDMISFTETGAIILDGCYSRSRLVEAGKTMDVDKVLSGQVERFGEKLVVTLRMIDVASADVEKTQVNEFLNLQPELQRMLEVTIKDMFGIPNDPTILNALTFYDGPVASPQNKIVNNGPRMGIYYLTDDAGKRLQAPIGQGGYDSYPMLSMFGYQFEVEYLTSGNFQALFEVIPAISGLEQQMLIPSITFMNGFRSGNSGWEVAFGPSVSINRIAIGYVDEDGNWRLQEEWNGEGDTPEFKAALDKRGPSRLNPGWVWGIGKTFRSGHLNIPVNAFVSPGKSGWLVGVSVGFNIKRQRTI